MKKEDKIIEDFGEEWSRYRYDRINEQKLYENFQEYFSIFPWEEVSSHSEGFDMGCGTGRWARFVAPQVGTLNCVDPSKAIHVAKENLQGFKNINFFIKVLLP